MFVATLHHKVQDRTIKVRVASRVAAKKLETNGWCLISVGALQVRRVR